MPFDVFVFFTFIRTTSILEAVCQKSQKESFFSSLWGCIQHSAQIRLPAVTFAVNHLAKHANDVDRKYVFGNDLNLMVCIFKVLLNILYVPSSIVLLQLNALSCRCPLEKCPLFVQGTFISENIEKVGSMLLGYQYFILTTGSSGNLLVQCFNEGESC